jgi:DNA-binding transcriptional MerR regulator
MNSLSIRKLTISKAAELFSVDKKTLMRWDTSGELKAYREPLTNSRYYLEAEIKWQAYWYVLRTKHRAHNRKLTEIRKKADKFLATTPLSEYQNPKMHDAEDMKSAYSALRNWEDEHKKIMNEYLKLPKGFKSTLI